MSIALQAAELTEAEKKAIDRAIDGGLDLSLVFDEVGRIVAAREAEAAPRRFTEHLVHNSLGSRCELTSFVDSSRCTGKAVAIRWEAGFADDVCEDHAETAIKRGAVVVFARHHDGTEG